MRFQKLPRTDTEDNPLYAQPMDHIYEELYKHVDDSKNTTNGQAVASCRNNTGVLEHDQDSNIQKERKEKKRPLGVLHMFKKSILPSRQKTLTQQRKTDSKQNLESARQNIKRNLDDHNKKIEELELEQLKLESLMEDLINNPAQFEKLIAVRKTDSLERTCDKRPDSNVMFHEERKPETANVTQVVGPLSLLMMPLLRSHEMEMKAVQQRQAKEWHISKPCAYKRAAGFHTVHYNKSAQQTAHSNIGVVPVEKENDDKQRFSLTNLSRNGDECGTLGHNHEIRIHTTCPCQDCMKNYNPFS